MLFRSPSDRSDTRSVNQLRDVDLVIVRENTEDLYSGLEHEVVPGDTEEPYAAASIDERGGPPRDRGERSVEHSHPVHAVGHNRGRRDRDADGSGHRRDPIQLGEGVVPADQGAIVHGECVVLPGDRAREQVGEVRVGEPLVGQRRPGAAPVVVASPDPGASSSGGAFKVALIQ